MTVPTLPQGSDSVFIRACRRQEVPGDRAWLPEIRRYERDVLSTRG